MRHKILAQDLDPQSKMKTPRAGEAEAHHSLWVTRGHKGFPVIFFNLTLLLLLNSQSCLYVLCIRSEPTSRFENLPNPTNCLSSKSHQSLGTKSHQSPPKNTPPPRDCLPLSALLLQAEHRQLPSCVFLINCVLPHICPLRGSV